jgi:ABC-2 type transport system ATP-binding protein
MIFCEDLSKQFNNFWAVDGVSLDVGPGEVLALLGQNGAGKTTTVRMLTAVLKPTRGWARVAGYDVAAQPERVRASVGVLSEMHGLYARMTAEEYLDYFGQVYGLDSATRRRRSRELIDYFGLSEAARRRTGQYSKGMRQKLALARALIHEPAILLLDEPTSAMDPESARLVRAHIASLRSANRAIVICTHNLSEAETLADKVAILYRGQIRVQGTLEELKRQTLGPREFDLTVGEGETDLRQQRIPAGIEVTSYRADGLRFKSADAARHNPEFVRELTAIGVPLISLQEVPRNLEQVYLKVMEGLAEGSNQGIQGVLQ